MEGRVGEVPRRKMKREGAQERCGRESWRNVSEQSPKGGRELVDIWEDSCLGQGSSRSRGWVGSDERVQ